MGVVIVGTDPGGSGGGPSGPSAFTLAVTTPTLLAQLVHGLGYRPAGVLCIDSSEYVAEPDAITFPLAGVVEVAFGVPFTGHIYLS